ncbi:MAG TPA: acyl-CoA thioesterase [Thermoanaerobaculia bacterium]|nr:acyl-CoA thioesterase [Thermoanaerobaculia bacterium]HMF08743.1 acyl-CoA thioesterase [Thermoanaerobaculia bacterium]
MSAARTGAVPPLKGFSIEIPVRFAECDSYGVVWHGHYALYLEQVREALTARFGFTAAKALTAGYKIPITRMEVRYRAPVLVDTVVTVTARLRPPEVARFVVDYQVRTAGGQLLADAVTEQVVVNPAGDLLLTLPGDLRRMADGILEYQKGMEGNS